MATMDLVITNLRMLRYPDVEDLSATSFSSIANHRLSDAIFVFLFAQIDRARTAKLFGNVYPPHGHGTRREFRALMYQWLEELKPHLHGSNWIRKSLLDDGRGERFQDLLLSFSTHALLKSLQHLDPAQAKSLSALGPQAPAAEAGQLSECCETYAELVAEHVQKQQQWIVTANGLEAENVALDSEIANLQSRVTAEPTTAEIQREAVALQESLDALWESIAATDWAAAESVVARALDPEAENVLMPPAAAPLRLAASTAGFDWNEAGHLAAVALRAISDKPIASATADPIEVVSTRLLIEKSALEQAKVRDTLRREKARLEVELERFPPPDATGISRPLLFPVVDAKSYPMTANTIESLRELLGDDLTADLVPSSDISLQGSSRETIPAPYLQRPISAEVQGLPNANSENVWSAAPEFSPPGGSQGDGRAKIRTRGRSPCLNDPYAVGTKRKAVSPIRGAQGFRDFMASPSYPAPPTRRAFSPHEAPMSPRKLGTGRTLGKAHLDRITGLIVDQLVHAPSGEEAVYRAAPRAGTATMQENEYLHAETLFCNDGFTARKEIPRSPVTAGPPLEAAAAACAAAAHAGAVLQARPTQGTPTTATAANVRDTLPSSPWIASPLGATAFMRSPRSLNDIDFGILSQGTPAYGTLGGGLTPISAAAAAATHQGSFRRQSHRSSLGQNPNDSVDFDFLGVEELAAIPPPDFDTS